MSTKPVFSLLTPVGNIVDGDMDTLIEIKKVIGGQFIPRPDFVEKPDPPARVLSFRQRN